MKILICLLNINNLQCQQQRFIIVSSKKHPPLQITLHIISYQSTRTPECARSNIIVEGKNEQLFPLVHSHYTATHFIQDKSGVKKNKSNTEENLLVSPIRYIQSLGKYKYEIKKGNNSKLIKAALKARPWWVECTGGVVNFRWQPVSKGINFNTINTGSIKQMINHFEFHRELSRKDNLFYNLKDYCEKNKENIFDCVPITFCLDISPHLPTYKITSILMPFIEFYNELERNKSLISSMLSQKEETKHSTALNIKPSTMKFQPFKSFKPQHTRFSMPLSHFVGHNLWLLKPTGLNRGRGIHVFHSLHKLKELILNYSSKKIGEIKEGVASSFTENHYIIQKYVERPLLIHNRKFDLRVWVLLTEELNCYFFREGYIRTSSTEYLLDPLNIENRFVHLTNNAVQKYCSNYGNFEDANQLSFRQFQNYLTQNKCGISVKEDIVPQMKEIVKKTIVSTRKKLNSENRKHCFEIFGYDFMIDVDYNVWLIEVNTNPCLEESSALLRSLLPRMIEDAMRLTLDIVFPPLSVSGNEKRIYSVSGYEDGENLWDLLSSTKENFHNISRRKLRSEYIISVNKHRKLKIKKQLFPTAVKAPSLFPKK